MISFALADRENDVKPVELVFVWELNAARLVVVKFIERLSLADSVENPVEIDTGVFVSTEEFIFDWLEEIGMCVCAQELPLKIVVVIFLSAIVVSPISVFMPLLVIDVFALLLPVAVEESMNAVPVRDDRVGSAPDTEELKTEGDQTEDADTVGSLVLDVMIEVAFSDDGDDTGRLWESERKEVTDPEDCTDEVFVCVGKLDTPAEDVTSTSVVEDIEIVVDEAVLKALLPVDNVPNDKEDRAP